MQHWFYPFPKSCFIVLCYSLSYSQLCLFLKKEAEERGIPVPITEERHNRSPNSGRRASLDLKALVETRLLTFLCLEELPQRNLELLETVRILEKELEQKFASQNESQKQKMMQTVSGHFVMNLRAFEET